MNIRYFGHATFTLEHDGTTVLIDPFFTSNPAAPVGADEVSADAILLTHGHFDHVEDAVAIARRTGASLVAIKEIADDIAEFVSARQVIPCHHDTFPPIETDAQAFKADVEAAGTSQVIILEPGETHRT